MTDQNRQYSAPGVETAAEPDAGAEAAQAAPAAGAAETEAVEASQAPEAAETIEVVGVRFRGRGKVYYFDPAGFAPAAGEQVVVETAKGNELGQCTQPVHPVPADSVVMPLRPVLRIATAADLRTAELNREKEKRAFGICQKKIEAHGLDMKLVDVEYSFEGTKILFFFTSEGRVDFRELVRDLASVFRTRIELRQIGVRDSAKLLGGLGICGRPFCCSTFLDEFQPVSIKMAKTQSLSLNPAKISGTCGRLMCCLKYEQAAYESLLKTAPKADTQVDTPVGHGVITEVNLLRQSAKVRLDDSTDGSVQSFPLRRLGYTVGGEYKPPEPEEEPAPPEEEERFGFLLLHESAPAQPRRSHGKGRGKGHGDGAEPGDGRKKPEGRKPRQGRGGGKKPRPQDGKGPAQPPKPAPAKADGPQAGGGQPKPRNRRRRRKPGGGQNGAKPAQEA